MLAAAPMEDMHGVPRSMLGRLLRSWDLRNAIRRHTNDAFGLSFVLDVTSGPQISVRMAKQPPIDAEHEASFSQRTLDYMADALPIDDFGDGVRAYTGIITAALSAEYRLLLIDEPEAFLHPPLVRSLGGILGQLAVARGGHVIIATHSADLVEGVLQSGVAVNLVRLTFDGTNGTARLLPNSVLRPLLRKPLLRSAGVIGALFHRTAVVTEGDPDRVLYAEVNRRLEAAARPFVRDAIFLNTNGNADLARVARPLREMGIPAAIIADLDSLSMLTTLLGAAELRKEKRTSIEAACATVIADFGAVDTSRTAYQNMKIGGVCALSGRPRARALRLIASLNDLGIFLVPVGTLEYWLDGIAPHQPITKSNWIRRTLEALGDEPAHPDYVQPRPGGVWRFISRVAVWTGNPQRRGMP
jgi:hypothetical protein